MVREVYECALFRDIPEERASDIFNRLDGRTKVYQKNETVLSEGAEVRDVGILLSGEICKVQYYPEGMEQMFQKLRKSYMVGLEVAMSQKKTSPYSLYTSQPTEVCWFPVRYIEEPGILKEADRLLLYRRIVWFLASEDIRKFRKIEILSARSVRDKIEKYMKTQRLRQHSDEFDIEFDREQLANYLGVNRSVLSHELKEMEREGLLTVRKNHFILHF